MGQVPRAVASFVLLVAFTAPAFAQSESTPPPLPAQPVAAAAQLAMAPDVLDDGGTVEAAREWARGYSEWKEWSAQWRNRRQPGWLTGYQDRREPPVPPSWLVTRCASIFDDTDPLMPACVLVREWNDGFLATALRQANLTSIQQQEDDSNTTWWEHVHLDVLWPAMQWRNSTYGVIGMHVATTVRGRLQAFVAPGAMLLNLPTRNGSRAWKFAANYGIGYRLFDFVFPGGRLASVHVNAARAWIVADVTDVMTGRTVDFAGFSLTFKKNP